MTMITLSTTSLLLLVFFFVGVARSLALDGEAIDQQRQTEIEATGVIGAGGVVGNHHRISSRRSLQQQNTGPTAGPVSKDSAVPDGQVQGDFLFNPKPNTQQPSTAPSNRPATSTGANFLLGSPDDDDDDDEKSARGEKKSKKSEGGDSKDTAADVSADVSSDVSATTKKGGKGSSSSKSSKSEKDTAGTAVASDGVAAAVSSDGAASSSGSGKGKGEKSGKTAAAVSSDGAASSSGSGKGKSEKSGKTAAAVSSDGAASSSGSGKGKGEKSEKTAAAVSSDGVAAKASPVARPPTAAPKPNAGTVSKLEVAQDRGYISSESSASVVVATTFAVGAIMAVLIART
jgi:hypothetical protein